MDYPNEIKAKLETAMQDTVSERQRYAHSSANFTRKRKLTAEETMRILLSMEGGSLEKELHRLGCRVSASSFVARRKLLSNWDFEYILEYFNQRCGWEDIETFHGYQVVAVDGSCINIARDPTAESFIQNSSNPTGYNQLHVTPLYDVINKLYIHAVVEPQLRQDEIGALLFMLQWYDVERPTLIFGDRGFESYNTFNTLMETPGVDFLIRVKQNHGAMREIRKLPMRELDTEVSFTITTTQTKDDKTNNYVFVQTHKNKNRNYSAKTRAGRWDFPSPYPMRFRVVRLMLSTGEWETLATSLPKSVTLEEIREPYHKRWNIEQAFREIKYSLNLVNLHGKSEDFAYQEIFAVMVMSNFCSRIVKKVVVRQDKRNKYQYAVNMKMAINLCRQFFRAKSADGEKFLEEIARYVVPVRPGRSNTRNLQPKGFAGFLYRVAA